MSCEAGDWQVLSPRLRGEGSGEGRSQVREEAMYWLMSIDALVRIAVAMVFLFVVIPRLSFRPRSGTTALERFFWNFGIGIAALTLAGQLLTLANLFSLVTVLLLLLLVVLIGQARQRGIAPGTFVKSTAETAVLAALNMFDKRVSVPRRLRRLRRRVLARIRAKAQDRDARRNVAMWSVLAAVAAAFRLYRPFASANLGFSDTYVHLYLLKLLEDGRQVDPEWGPYPRGLQFLLLTIQELTNVDEILLMNFFGAVVGVVMTLAVAETARRLSGSAVAALVAGLLFATLVGGPGQYFIAGGAFAGNDTRAADSLRAIPYEQLVAARAQFDIALTDFQRQTSTLSQELAIALLFPTALFLFGFLRTGDRWQLAGYAGGAAAIAAVHSGVVVALVFMSALVLPAVALERRLQAANVRKAVGVGAAAVIVGSAWALAFIAYPYAGGKSHASGGTSVATAVFYYFPFLRSLAPPGLKVVDEPGVFVAITPFLAGCGIVAVVWALLSLRRPEDKARRVWIAAVFTVFLIVHFSSRLGIPQILEPVRNSQWLLMAMAVLIGMVLSDVVSLLAEKRAMKRTTAAAVVVLPLLVLWGIRVPRLGNPVIRDQIVNYSGYGGAALAVLRIARAFEPYTWTLVSYGQEFPMVLREGFHVPAATFLERYDPSAQVVPIPTPHVFVIVEKTAHPFQINSWARSFSRAGLEERLQTWIHVYQANHRNLRVFFEDEHVRVYQIERTPAEIDRAMQREGGR
jgi:hypothetical protein